MRRPRNLRCAPRARHPVRSLRYFKDLGLFPVTNTALAPLAQDPYVTTWSRDARTSDRDETSKWPNGADLTTIVGEEVQSAMLGQRHRRRRSTAWRPSSNQDFVKYGRHRDVAVRAGPSRAWSADAPQRRVGLLLALPTLVAFAGVILLPFRKSMGLSLYNFTMMAQAPVFDGLANFPRLVRTRRCSFWINTAGVRGRDDRADLRARPRLGVQLDQSFHGRALLRAASLLPGCCPRR